MKPLVLLSGGLDSAVALAMTIRSVQEDGPVKTLFFDYGQHNRWERTYAFKLARHYSTDHKSLMLDDRLFGQTGVMRGALDENKPPTTAEAAIIPFRNGILFSIAVAQAISMGCDRVVVGTHGVDSGFPDCSSEFIIAFRQAVMVGSGHKVHLDSPLQQTAKSGIVMLGAELGVPFALTRSCYVSESGCGECIACRIRAEAFAANEMKDPAMQHK